MPRKQIWSGIALAAAAGATLSGCSLKASDGTPTSLSQLSSLSAQDAVKAAVRAVAAHPSAKVHTVLDAPDTTETTDVTAAYGEHPALQGTLAIAAAGSTPNAASTVPLRYSGQVMFMNMSKDSSMAAMMGGKEWLRMDLGAPAVDPRMAAIGDDVLENTSPAKGLTMLTAAKDLHKVGEEARGGVQTVHYAGTVTGADALDPNLIGRGLTQEDADTVSQSLVHGVVTSLTYDVWLREDGLPVAQTFLETAAGGSLKGTIEFSGWDTGVSVDEVPDGQSVDYMTLLAKASASPSEEASPSAEPSASSSPSSPSAPTTPSATGSSSAPSAPATPSTPATPATPATPSKPTPTGSPATPATPSSST